ncbi:hypothetical protein CLOSPO_01712 [Clostridium sporogenes ATCC 15579]|nr:hypothetical protein CLOSPO_01712 [Clostridium sporogenes ATCC 15579]
MFFIGYIYNTINYISYDIQYNNFLNINSLISNYYFFSYYINFSTITFNKNKKNI